MKWTDDPAHRNASFLAVDGDVSEQWAKRVSGQNLLWGREGQMIDKNMILFISFK